MPPSRKYKRKTGSAARAKRFTSRSLTSKIKKVHVSMEPNKYQQQSIATNPLGGIGSRWTFIANLSNIPFESASISDSHSRTGTKVYLQNIESRIRVTVAAGDGTDTVRFALIKGLRTGSLNAGDIGYHASGNDASPFLDDVALPFNYKFVKVLWTKTFNVQEQVTSSGAAAGAVRPNYADGVLHKTINKTLKFVEDESVTAPFNNQSYYLVACSNSAAVPHPQCSGYIRTKWKDLE